MPVTLKDMLILTIRDGYVIRFFPQPSLITTVERGMGMPVVKATELVHWQVDILSNGLPEFPSASLS